MHDGAKKRKFCKDSGCWERLCPHCAQERHRGHNVVDFATVLGEVKTAKEKVALAKSVALGEYKDLALGMEHMQRRFGDRQNRICLDARKIELDIEGKIKSMSQAISRHKERLQGLLRRGFEGIETGKVELGRTINKLSKLVEQIATKGESQDIRLFFETYTKGRDPDRELKRMKDCMAEADKELTAFESLDPCVFFTDPSSPPRSLHSSPVPAPASAGKIGKSPIAIQSAKAPGSAGRTRNQTHSLISSLSPVLRGKPRIYCSLTPRDLPAESHAEQEGSLERQRRMLERLAGQVSAKAAALQQLEAAIRSRESEIDVLEKKKEQIIQANNVLLHQIEQQNRAFASGLIHLTPSPPPPRNAKQGAFFG